MTYLAVIIMLVVQLARKSNVVSVNTEEERGRDEVCRGGRKTSIVSSLIKRETMGTEQL